MKKIFVTGGAGFVGRHLCEVLTRKSYSVHALVRRPQPNESSVIYHLGSLTDICNALAPSKDIDCVIHLAGRAHVLADQSLDPLAEFRAVNVQGTLVLARQAIAAGVKRFIFISSIGVNGSHTTGKAFDESSMVAPHADYALSKLEAEQGLRELVKGSDMELVIIRPPLVYAGNAPGNFQRLLKLVASGVPLPFASVDNTRSMVALDNLVSFIGLCVEHPAAANEMFLISDGIDVSTPEIISNLSKGMGRKGHLWSLPDKLMCWGASLLGKQAMYSQLCGSLAIDSHKAQDLLGWRPVVSASDALQQAGRDFVSLHVQ